MPSTNKTKPSSLIALLWSPRKRYPLPDKVEKENPIISWLDQNKDLVHPSQKQVDYLTYKVNHNEVELPLCIIGYISLKKEEIFYIKGKKDKQYFWVHPDGQGFEGMSATEVEKIFGSKKA